MTTHPQTCDLSLIERYLADLLDAATEAGFHSHLENCNACRDRIQLAAAEASSWNDAEEFLKDQPFDEVSLSTSSSVNHDDNHANDRKASASVEIAQVLGLLHPTDDPQMLGRLGGYEVSGVIGSGGMGVVLKAFDGALDRTVAMKVLAPRLASSGAARVTVGSESHSFRFDVRNKHFQGVVAMKSSETDLILSLGVEGGGAKFFRNQSSNCEWEFTYAISGGGIELPEFEDTSSPSKPHDSGPFSTLDEAISHFSKSGEWVHFYPKLVHPEFGEQVWNLRVSVLKRLEITDDSRHHKWFKVCHRAVKKRSTKELVLSLGFEGGGIDFYREVNPKGQVRFSQKSNSGGFDMSDFVDDEASPPPTPKRRARTKKYASLELALAAEGLDGIWITAYPENVHPDFQNEVWDLRQRLLSERDPSLAGNTEHSDFMWAKRPSNR